MHFPLSTLLLAGTALISQVIAAPAVSFSSSTCPATSTKPRKTRTHTSTSYTSTSTSVYTYTSALVYRTKYTTTIFYSDTRDVGSATATTTYTNKQFTDTATVNAPGPTTPTTTLYVPTTCGFTPVKSEAVFTAVSKTVTERTNTTTTIYKTVMIPTYYYSTASYSYISGKTTTVTNNYLSSVFTDPPISTVTVTETPSRSTVYQACGTDNIVSRLPDGSGISSYGLLKNNAAFHGARVADAVACCALCQRTPYCSGTIFYLHPQPADNVNCIYVLFDTTQPESQICANNKIAYAEADSSSYPEDQLVVSNGPCGQIFVNDYFEN